MIRMKVKAGKKYSSSPMEPTLSNQSILHMMILQMTVKGPYRPDRLDRASSLPPQSGNLSLHYDRRNSIPGEFLGTSTRGKGYSQVEDGNNSF